MSTPAAQTAALSARPTTARPGRPSPMACPRSRLAGWRSPPTARSGWPQARPTPAGPPTSARVSTGSGIRAPVCSLPPCAWAAWSWRAPPSASCASTASGTCTPPRRAASGSILRRAALPSGRACSSPFRGRSPPTTTSATTSPSIRAPAGTPSSPTAPGAVGRRITAFTARRTPATPGPWWQIGSVGNLAGSGSAMKNYVGYKPGVQAWYNQMILVDPGNADHLFVGLEEVYETRDAGTHWFAVSPYWNFEFACWSLFDGQNTCPMAPHSDQHSIAVDGGRLYIGNDGGIYLAPVNQRLNTNGNGTEWMSLNANLRTLQYYGVGAGLVPGGVAVSGGLQDNGTSLLLPEDAKGNMGSNAGGDGGKIIVDPENGCNILTEYPALDLWKITNCGRTDGSFSAIFDVAPPEYGARFIAPMTADTVNKDHWVVGGQYVWTYANGFAIRSGSEWVRTFNQGAGHATTVLASQNDVIWSAWCGPCNNVGFTRGI